MLHYRLFHYCCSQMCCQPWGTHTPDILMCYNCRMQITSKCLCFFPPLLLLMSLFWTMATAVNTSVTSGQSSYREREESLTAVSITNLNFSTFLSICEIILYSYESSLFFLAGFKDFAFQKIWFVPFSITYLLLYSPTTLNFSILY